MKPRILYAGVFHETHTFLDAVTRWEDFDVALGSAILAKAGDESPTAGFLEEAQQAGWDVLPTIDARAVPSGPVEDAVFERIWAEFAARARPLLAAGVDGIFLVLHGAMVTVSLEDPEGEFLARLRALPGAASLPVFGVLDLHANVTARMCALADGLVTYRKNPHIDAKYSAQRAARLLGRCLATGRWPRLHWCRVPIVWAPPGTGTEADPMLSLNLLAEKIESVDPAVWCFNVAAGFSFADTAETGLTLSLVHDGPPERAREHLLTSARLAWKLRERGLQQYPDASDVLTQLGSDPAGPVLLVEPADNIGGGAPGDGTGILRALLANNAARALVAINDPAAVAALAGIALGGSATVAIGGRGWPRDPGPVPLEVTLVSRSDGTFRLEDPHSHLASMSGIHYAMGPSAVVRHHGITILLTSRKTPPFDLGQFRSQGIEPRAFSLIGVKAAVAHRRAYEPIAIASYFVDTPGPCSSNLAHFPFRRLRRPVFPLDPITEPVFTCT